MNMPHTLQDLKEKAVRTAIRMMMLAVTGLAASGAAQDFVFVSNRLPAEPPVSDSGQLMRQNELFRYEDGSEIRLTFTPSDNEWDPQPSPSGRYVAYYANDTVVDWAAAELPDTWDWYLRILDLESGLLLEEWLLPDSAGSTRMAGGFQTAWLPDESGLYAQVMDAGHDGLIARFTIGSPTAMAVSRGTGLHLDAARGWLATALDGYATVIDPFSGNQYPLVLGEPLGWVGDQLVVGGAGPLMLMDPVTAERNVLDSSADYYPFFAVSPAGSRYVWLSYSLDSTGTRLVVTDGNFAPVASWLRADYIESAHWLDEGTLLLTGMLADTMAITRLDVSEGFETDVVATRSDNLTVRLLGR